MAHEKFLLAVSLTGSGSGDDLLLVGFVDHLDSAICLLSLLICRVSLACLTHDSGDMGVGDKRES